MSRIALLPPELEPLYRLAAEGDSARFAMTGVHLEIDGDDCVATATDGRVLGTVRFTMPKETAFPALPDLLAAPNSGTKGVIGSKDWRAGFKRIPGVSKKRPRWLAAVMGVESVLEGPLAEAKEGRRPTVAAPLTLGTASGERGEVTPHTLIEGRFPDWRQVFPRRPAKMVLSIHPEVLFKLIDATEAMCDEDAFSVRYTFGAIGQKIPFVWKAGKGCIRGEFECAYEMDWHEELEICLNPANLRRVAAIAAGFICVSRSHKLHRLQIEFRDSSTPVLITSEASSFRGLVMPLSC